jgi:fermentation-respiration switch protein FrsA (DUF1100 family)
VAQIVALVLAGLYLILLAAVALNERRLLYFPHALAASPPDSAIEVVQIETADGERLVGWYRPPAAGRPTIVFFDGNGGRLDWQAGRWRDTGAAGVGQLSVAYRGYGGSTGTPTEAGLHADARAAYAWLTARHAPADIVVHGFSLGSGVAVRLASERPIRALILEAPFTATVDVAAERYPFLPVRLLMRDRFESRAHIGRVSAPVLFAHGEADRVVPFRSGQRLYALADPPKRFVRYPGADHTDLPSRGLYAEIWRFLDVSQAPPSSSPPAPAVR